ncbi:MAG: hypothetical protein J6K48_01400 [Lachnospiraceae bacterium]|nr:hypothetical protein [Lachnospiraceae bacterium]
MSINEMNVENGRVKLAFTANFTQIPNAGLSKDLSLSASGLYSRIVRLASIPNVPLTKAIIKNNCREKEKAFDATWNELKEKGYITQYLQPKATGRGWYQEYEILEKPRKDGIHTIYRDKNGAETGTTNLTRKQNRDRYPLNRSNGHGIYGQGGNNINNNIININKKSNNIISNSPTKFQNQFNQFMHQDYDFKQLEMELLKSNQLTGDEE